jgi:hypothetical protein
MFNISFFPLFHYSNIPLFQFHEVLTMADQPRNKSTKVKKPYVRPEIRQVPLKPEEAVLGLCKQTGIAGPGLPSGNACGYGVSPCSSIGS